MNILGINGSPRPAGHTGTLIGDVLAGAAEAGAATELFQLGRMTVSPCIDCDGCRATARCVLEDDNQRFYGAVAEARAPRGLVIGTPIYLDHVSAQLKVWIDRLHAYNYTKLGNFMFPDGFRAVLVVTYGAADPHLYDFVVDWLAGLIEDRKVARVVDRIVLPGTQRLPISLPEDVRQRARQIGRRLAT
ncbi:MAG: flavodoxin family protein [Planctomycetes bacterium]|nr:flavodoxin family protein [Planctomycetota bacterium]